MIRDNYVEEDTKEKKEEKEIKLKIEKLRKRIDNLIEMRADGEISKEDFLRKRDEILSEMSELESKLNDDNMDSDSPESIERKIEVIENALREVIDFSQAKLPRYVIDKFISKVEVLDNDLFRWHIKFPSPDGSHVDTHIEGRKNKSTAEIVSEKSLCCVQSSSGSYRTKIGENQLLVELVIPFRKARDYRKSDGKYLRCNQWNDIKVEIAIEA